MAAKQSSANVQSFVRTARRLIVVQVIVAIVAAAASLWATYSISEALKQQRLARDAEQLALLRQQAADESTLQSQKYVGLAASVRDLLQAQTPDEYAEVADRLKTIVSDPDADVPIFVLLATAQYNAAGSHRDGFTRADWYTLAFVTMGNAIERNQRRLDREMDAATDESIPVAERPSPPSDLYESIYLDRVAYYCAAQRAAGAAPEETAYLTYIAGAHNLVKAALKANGVLDHALLRRECGPNVVAQIESQLETLPISAETTAAYRITAATIRIRSESDRALANAVAAQLGTSFRIATELVGEDYEPAVRYFYDPQAEQAAAIQGLTLSAAQTEGRSWGPNTLPRLRVRGPAGLARDRVEIWLPANDAQSRTPLQQIRVRYYLRDADRDRVERVLNGWVQYTVLAPRTSLDPVNTLSCHPRIGAAALAEFKTLAIALIDAGVPIVRVKALDDPAANAPNSVTISFLAAPNARTLTRPDIEALTGCPVSPFTRAA